MVTVWIGVKVLSGQNMYYRIDQAGLINRSGC